ncbi:MAG: hypothetical protein Q9198_007703, partial [Flavoplaca austrocitrina]
MDMNNTESDLGIDLSGKPMMSLRTGFLTKNASDEAIAALLNNDSTNAEASAALGDWTDFSFGSTISNAVTDDLMAPLMQ